MHGQQWYDDTHSNNMQTHGKIYATATTCFCASQQVQRCLCRNSSDCANWTCHPGIQRHGVAYPRLHKTRDALISYCKFPAVRNWLMKGEWAIADRGLHFPNIIYMIDEVYHIIIFHCIWHSCLLHGKDGICRGDSQILVSSRAVTKMWPWHVSVGPAGHPVLRRATRRGSEEETRNHHPASHWGEHGTIAAWHRTWCWIEGQRLDVCRFYTNLEPEPSGMLSDKTLQWRWGPPCFVVVWCIRIFHPMQLGTFNVIRWPRSLRMEIFGNRFQGSAGIVDADGRRQICDGKAVW